MEREPNLQPTLWRTCRVLANRKRLRILKFLFDQPGQTVSAVAAHLRLSLPVASLYLRALESRGLVMVQRKGRYTIYRPSRAPTMRAPQALVPALKLAFEQETDAVEQLFKFATAFTHPRRIELFRMLRKKRVSLNQILAGSGMSRWALLRHLRKLESRNYAIHENKMYWADAASNSFSRALAQLAAG